MIAMRDLGHLFFRDALDIGGLFTIVWRLTRFR